MNTHTTTFPCNNPHSNSNLSNDQPTQQILLSQARASKKRPSELPKITQLDSNVGVCEGHSKRVRTHSFFPSHYNLEQNNFLHNSDVNNQTHSVTTSNERGEYYHTKIYHSDWIVKDFAEMLQFWEVNEKKGAFETIREKLNGIGQKIHTLDTKLCNVVKLVDLSKARQQNYTTTTTNNNNNTNQIVTNNIDPPVLIPSRTTKDRQNGMTEQHNPPNNNNVNKDNNKNNPPQTPTKLSVKKVPISPPPFVIPTLPSKRPHPLDLNSKVSSHNDKQFKITQFPYVPTSHHPQNENNTNTSNAITHANTNSHNNNNIRYNIDKNVPSSSSFSPSFSNPNANNSNKHPVVYKQPLSSIMLIIPPSPFCPSTPLPKLEATNPISLSSMNEKILCSHLPFILLNVADSEFNTFIDFWLKVPAFSWSLVYSSLIVQRNVETDIIGEDEFTFLPKHIVIQGVCVCWSKEIVYYISLKNQYPSKNGTETLPLSPSQIWERFRSLKKVFEQNDTAKILFLMKPQIKLLLSKDIFVKGYILDPMIGAWLIDPDFHKEKTIEQLVDHFAPTALRAPRSIATSNDFERGCVKSFYSFMLMPFILNAMQSTPRVRSIFLNLEMPVIPILAEMEFCGIGYEASVVYKQKEAISLKLKSLERKAHSLAGGEFSLTSLSEVSDILFNTLKLPPPPPKNGKTSRARKHHCVNAEVLESLASKHPLPLVILEHRKLSHLMSNYVDTLESFCFHDDRFNMKRIYSTILQTAAPTGRLAMNYPNLQAITHEIEFLATSQSSGEISEEESPDYEIYKENNNANHLKPNPNLEASSGKKGMVNVSVRSAFLVSCGHVLLAADYCQIEFRILAHLCRDEILLNFLSQPTDVFKLLAGHLRNKPLEMITDYDRATTKHVVYGVLYGMGPRALGERLGVSKSEGARRLAEFKSMFSGVGDYLEKVLVECKKNGFVETIYGRRRYLPNIYSSDFKESSKAERQVLNTICQGSAADIVKRAMIVIVDRLKKVNSRTHLLLQLHDELLFEVPIQQLAAVKILVKQTMEQVANLAVPLPVRISTGPNWGEMSPAD